MLPNDEAKSTINLRDPVWFREWFKVVMREWALELTMQQVSVVLFIMDRTAAWGKEWELIRYTSFVDGITSKDGSKRYAAGVCNSVSTATRITNELIALDMLCKRRSKAGNYWALNYNRNNKTDMKKTRKITRNQSPVTGSNHSSVSGSNRSSVTARKKVIPKREEASQKINTRPAKTSPFPPKATFDIAGVLSGVKNRAAESRQRRIAKRGGKLNSTEVNQLWAATIQDAEWVKATDLSAGRLYLTKVEAKALKSYSDRYATNYPKQSFRDFLPWMLNNWHGLRTELFAWMDKHPAPETPNALFIIKWATKFEEQYSKRDAFDKLLEMTPEERQLDRLVRSGMPIDQAKAKVYKKPMAGRYVAGGNAIKPEPTETKRFKPKTKPLRNRKSAADSVGLPKLDESYADEFEN
jgi:hypothetical protein